MDTTAKVALGAAAVVVVAGAAAYFLLPKPAVATPEVSSIVLSASTTSAVQGEDVMISADATGPSGTEVTGVPLYLFYSVPGSTSWTLLTSSTTNSSGVAQWEFSAPALGTYFLVASTSSTTSDLPAVPS